jgi:hypothetical protein
MKNVSFHLETTANSFAQLLSELTQFVHLRKFPPRFPVENEGHFVLQPVRLPKRKIGRRTAALDVVCSYVAEGEEATTDYPAFWAIRFTIVTPARGQIKVTAACSHEPVMGYFDRLLEQIGWRFPESPRAVEVTATGWPEVMDVDSTDLQQTTRVLPFERREIHRHLRAVCDYDARFLILEPETGNDAGDDGAGELTVCDAEAIRRACTTRQATIGAMRLLQAEGGFGIEFTPRDAPFHHENPDRGGLLLREFIRRVNGHFDELERQQAQQGSPSPAGDAVGDERGPNVGTLDRVRKAHRLIKAGWSMTAACKEAHTDPRTYYYRCFRATGEEPIAPIKDT